MTRLLVVRLSALGDVIHTIPAVVSLRDRFDISWAVEAPYAELVEIVAGVKPLPVRLKRWSARAIHHARKSVRGFDVAIDFQGLIKSALLTRASGAAERYGFARPFVREKPASLFYNHHVRVDSTQHVVDWNAQLANALTKSEQRATIANWSAYPHDPQNRLGPLKAKVVLLPGAGKAAKLWPLERFRELAKRYPNALVVTGPGERTLGEQIGGLVAPETNLRELAFILQHAQIVVGGDTGPLHLADALGTKVVGLYGPTDPRRNGPYGQLQRTIKRADMNSITVAEVIETIDEVIAE